MHKYRQLTVWQDAIDFAVEVYTETQNFPVEEKYGLTSQLRRAAVSIASNIAEGSCRNTDNEFNHFLGISAGSTAEADTQFIIANRLGFLDDDSLKELTGKCDKISNKLWKLKESIKRQ